MPFSGKKYFLPPTTSIFFLLNYKVIGRPADNLLLVFSYSYLLQKKIILSDFGYSASKVSYLTYSLLAALFIFREVDCHC